MTIFDVDATRVRLSKIRQRAERLKDDRWEHEQSADGDRIMVARAVFGSDGKRAGFEAPVALCSFGMGATVFEKELVRDAALDLVFVLDQLAIAGQMIRDLRSASRAQCGSARTGFPPADDERPSKDYSAEASMKCAEPGFQNWLRDYHATDDDGDLSDSAAAAAVLRRLLKIESRRQLNTDPDAAQRWRDLRADFQAWGRGDAT